MADGKQHMQYLWLVLFVILHLFMWAIEKKISCVGFGLRYVNTWKYQNWGLELGIEHWDLNSKLSESFWNTHSVLTFWHFIFVTVCFFSSLRWIRSWKWFPARGVLFFSLLLWPKRYQSVSILDQSASHSKMVHWLKSLGFFLGPETTACSSEGRSQMFSIH